MDAVFGDYLRIYATHEEEDMKLQNSKWNLHFPAEDGTRVVMHDNTNLPFKAPRSADPNRAMCSDCHNGCVAKGGVLLHNCVDGSAPLSFAQGASMTLGMLMQSGC
jgi:hypothetical protein